MCDDFAPRSEGREVPRAPSVIGDARHRRWWGRERFFNADGSLTECPEVIDLTGRHRFLFYGPYDHVEAGRWRATVSFHLSDDASRRSFLIQFGSDPEYTTVELAAPVRSGRQDIVVERLIEADCLAQVRVYLARAAFHGEFRFIGVSAERLGGD